MYTIRTLNNIARRGLDALTPDYVLSNDHPPDAIILRSFNLHAVELPNSVRIVARAGAGVNNIPLEDYAERGIVVVNTPGANANAVKELVVLGLLLSSRKVLEGITWAKSLKGEAHPEKRIEKEKGRFAGSELTGKRIGVIGLGAIGVLVANTCQDLGMTVLGYDPFISVNSAWGLSRKVKREQNLDVLMASCDYLTLHVPLIDETRSMITWERLSKAKKGLVLLNFARGGLVRTDDVENALDQGFLKTYVTDFPDAGLLQMDQVISIPHLGASTAESEENCAVMAVNSLREYLEHGNIIHSVNYPDCYLGPCETHPRLSICNRNIPSVMGNVTSLLSARGHNISAMKNQSKGMYAYTLIETDGPVDDALAKELETLPGVLSVRVILPRSSQGN